MRAAISRRGSWRGGEARWDRPRPGILGEVFVPEVTTVRATCANCGTIPALGALLVYTQSMGAVIRCPSCYSAVLRVARTRTRLWLDPTGARRASSDDRKD
jgi:DNA-directed RNA polymerase subunit RPC12/RpoP